MNEKSKEMIDKSVEMVVTLIETIKEQKETELSHQDILFAFAEIFQDYEICIKIWTALNEKYPLPGENNR